MKNIVLIGSSGHAKVIIDIVEKQGCFHICGLLDRFRNVGESTLGYSVLGSEIDLPQLVTKLNLEGVIIAIGDNNVRARVASDVSKTCPELPFVSAVHPNAVIGKGTVIDMGSVVMAGAVVSPCCRIGQFCIVNTRSSLDHDSVMENFSSLGPGATTGGNCHIGAHSAVGIGAVLRHGVDVGAHSVVGGGAVVVSPVPSFSVTYGVPAKKIRSREADDKYL